MNQVVRNKISTILMNDDSISCSEMQEILELVDSMIPPVLKPGQIWKGSNGNLVVISPHPHGEQRMGYSYIRDTGIDRGEPMRESYVRREKWILLFSPD